MIRKHENTLALRAGALSVLVHVVLLVLLLVSFNWKTVQPASIAQVELWDSLPAPAPKVQPVPKPEPVPEPPKPEPVPEPPKPEPVPEPPKPEPIIEPEPPKPEPKAEIQIKKEPVKKPKPKVEKPKEKPKPDPAIKARELEKKRQEEIKRIQEMFATADQQPPQPENNEAQEAADKAAQAASAGIVDEYMNKISNKIRGYVNPQLCGADIIELKFKIAVLPTGELVSAPKLIKSSGLPVCDQAVERAILQAEPLPLPEQPDLRALFRDITLPFYPNGR